MEYSIHTNPLPPDGFSADLSNYTAAELFIQSLAGEVNQHDVESILQAQKVMLLRFEKTNEMLINCNALSAARLHSATVDFKRHTQQLLEMKKDLDSVFRRIRALKAKLSVQYSAAFEACSDVYNLLEEDSENSEPQLSSKRQDSSTASAGADATPSEECAETLCDASMKVPAAETTVSQPPSSSCSQATTPSPVTSPSTSDTG